LEFCKFIMVNFSHAVEKRLVDLVTENLDAINNKDKNANGNRRRIDTWEKISNTLNAENTFKFHSKK